MVTKNAIALFLKEYDLKISKLEGRKITEDKAKFSTLLSSYSIFRRLVNRLDTKEARGYNIFDIIKVNHLEEKVHTPFLTNLLDPKGTHSQGALFYESFIEILAASLPYIRTFICSDYSYLNVIAEKNTGSFGEIDILLYNTHPIERFAIIVENKIWASDQKEQLSRYYRYAIESLKVAPDRILLIYLTPYGNPASEISIQLSSAQKLQDSNSLLFISYKHHINQWLNSVLPYVEANKVKQVLIQYIDTIKLICNE